MVSCTMSLSKGKMLKNRVGHVWQSISLIASNAAAVLPAYWCLRQKVMLTHSL